MWTLSRKENFLGGKKQGVTEPVYDFLLSVGNKIIKQVTRKIKKA
jgi:hypothetical protein